MKYVACLLPVCLVGCIVQLPAPKPGSAAAAWDNPVDPDGDCQFIRNQGTLIIQVPGRDHDLGAERGVMNAPRQLRDAQGDFAVQVRVDGAFLPTNGSTTASRASYNGAGLLLMVDNGTYVRLERAALFKNGQYSSFLAWELRVNGQTAPTGWNQTLPLQNAATYLRLERRGDALLASESQDGQEWNNLPPLNLNLPPTVKIGLHAVSTSAAPFSPQFSDFRLTGG
jgi:regulation of enolase protein 1 (concanavalin A-like superfamily)